MSKNNFEKKLEKKMNQVVLINMPNSKKYHHAKLSEMHELQGNLKDFSEEAYQKLKSRILEVGYKYPGFVWFCKKENKYYIIDSHHRKKTLLRMQKEGIKIPDKYPVIFIEAKDKKEAAKELLFLNSQYGKITKQGLNDYLKKFEIKSIEIKNIEIKEYRESIEETKNDDELPEEIENITKLGDLWELNEHRILCDDSLNYNNINKLIKENEIDMLFTDPPYGLGGYGGRNRMKLKGDKEDCRKFYKSMPIFNEMYIWGNFFNYGMLNFKPRDIIIWKKNNFGLGKGYRGQYELCFYKGNFNGSDSDIWEINKDINYKHPTQKPIELCLRAIQNSQPKNILDLYLGSGGTLIASEKTNRICYGIELEEYYCDIIIQRWIKWMNDNNKEIKNVKLNGKDFDINNFTVE